MLYLIRYVFLLTWAARTHERLPKVVFSGCGLSQLRGLLLIPSNLLLTNSSALWSHNVRWFLHSVTVEHQGLRTSGLNQQFSHSDIARLAELTLATSCQIAFNGAYGTLWTFFFINVFFHLTSELQQFVKCGSYWECFLCSHLRHFWNLKANCEDMNVSHSLIHFSWTLLI